MAYFTGSATNFADMKTAIYNAAVANGFTLSNDIISKNGCFYKIVTTTSNIVLSAGTGQSGATLTTPCSYSVKIFQPTSSQAVIISFPVNYEIHTFANPDELYFIINYNSDYYQQLSFGKSNVVGIGGTGSWFSGSSNAQTSESSTSASTTSASADETSWGFGRNNTAPSIAGSPFAFNGQGRANGSYIHTDLENVGWHIDNISSSTVGAIAGPGYCASLLWASPSPFNQATLLVPVKCHITRSGGKTLAAQLVNMRHCRIDNHTPGEVITYGSEKWKLYPAYRKEMLYPDFQNGNVTHSGAYGMAIKYQGN